MLPGACQTLLDESGLGDHLRMTEQDIAWPQLRPGRVGCGAPRGDV